jgi:hypothetical protein
MGRDTDDPRGAVEVLQARNTVPEPSTASRGASEKLSAADTAVAADHEPPGGADAA